MSVAAGSIPTAALSFAGVRMDAVDVRRVAEFWAQILAWHVVPRAGGALVVTPGDGAGYPIVVTPTEAPKQGQNRIHFDLTTTSREALQDIITRSCELGGKHVDIGQAPDEPHTVLADPEGNEFCVIPPENRFLAHTGTIGAVNCDGTRDLGLFWSRALGWPLVWDQNEETAIQSPAGGSKITWSGPPLMPRTERDRLRLEISANGPLARATDFLGSLGASLVSSSSDQALLTDPDGNEFHLMARADEVGG